MPLSHLAKALKAKQKFDNLSISVMAKAIGASAQSVQGALKGTSTPNKTTVPKFAKFLGLSLEEFAQLTKGETKTPAKNKPTPAKAKTSIKAVKTTKASKADKIKASDITLAEAAALAADHLAVATHRATAAQRKVIVAVLGL